MQRGYRARDLINAAAEIHRRFPFVVLRTQMIAGFPSETEQEFEDSIAVIDQDIFDYVDVFRYTPWDHTTAASIEPKVSFDVIMRRYIRLFLKSLFNRPVRKVQAIRRLNL
jgi:tRNA A37 methylthiotransferase MiaB